MYYQPASLVIHVQKSSFRAHYINTTLQRKLPKRAPINFFHARNVLRLTRQKEYERMNMKNDSSFFIKAGIALKS